MKNIIVIMVSVQLFVSCSSLIKKAQVHAQMAEEIQTNGYEMSINRLYEKVVGVLDGSNKVEEKIIMISGTQGFNNSEKTQEKIREWLRQGFVYKDKFYTSEVDVTAELLSLNLKRVKNKIDRSQFHTIERTMGSFMIVHDDILYKGTSLEDNRSSLKVYTIQNVERAINFSVDWYKLLLKSKIGFRLSPDPINLEKSMNYLGRNDAEALRIFFRILPKKAHNLENELLSKLN